MNLMLLISLAILHLCTSQEYGTPTYNPDQASPTNEYYNPSSSDPKYDNPYDPNRRYQNRNQLNQPNQNQYDLNRNPYEPNKIPYDSNRNPYDPSRVQYENRNDPNYNQNQYNGDVTPKTSWDNGRIFGNTYNSAPVEHNTLIINEA